jgi:hypothetical protein
MRGIKVILESGDLTDPEEYRRTRGLSGDF